MRAAILLCTFLLGTATLVAADSRRLLDASNSLDALLKANDFQKIGKDAPGPVTASPPPPPSTSSPPPPPPTYYAAPPSNEICPIPDLDNYYEVEGCQCDCVVSWQSLTPAPAPSIDLPPLEPKKKLDLIQKLEDDFGLLVKGRRLQSLVWDLKKNATDDFEAKWPANMNLQGCTEPVPTVVDHFKQCKCKCPSTSSPPPPVWTTPASPPPTWTTPASPPPNTWTQESPPWTPAPIWTPTPSWTPSPPTPSTPWVPSPPTPSTPWTASPPAPVWTPAATPPTWSKPDETSKPGGWTSKPEGETSKPIIPGFESSQP